MAKKAEYRSAIRSRRLIRNAFIELLQEENLEKITVTSIVNLADINRGTFYAHYQDIHSVIEQIENEIIEKMMEILKEFQFQNFFQNPKPLLTRVSKYLESDAEFYRVLITSHGADTFLIKLQKIFIEYMMTDSDVPDSIKESNIFIVRINFFAGGIINLYKEWFHEDFNIPLDVIATEISILIQESSKNLLNSSG